MGGCSSKPAVEPEPLKGGINDSDTDKSDERLGAQGETATSPASQVLPGLPTKTAPQTTSFRNAKEALTQPSKQRNRKLNDDKNWAALWNAHHTMLLDPADIHSTIEDLMARATNNLSPSEITLIQRKVRKVIRKVNDEGGKKKGLLAKSSSSNALEQESRVIADRNHLLSNQVVQQILPTFATSVGSSVDPVKAIYLLLQYSHESLWDRVADIAAESAKAAAFNMDVNSLHPPTACPTVYTQSPKEPDDLPPGISLQSLTSLMGLALRKLFSNH
jgi:hypothetical protein